MVDAESKIRCDCCKEEIREDFLIRVGKWILCDGCVVEIRDQVAGVLARKRALCAAETKTTASISRA